MQYEFKRKTKTGGRGDPVTTVGDKFKAAVQD
jgi:hypothetical protein